MKHLIDRTAWERREYFDFFSRMDDPYFGVVVNADFTRCFREAKARGVSFTLSSMHRILRAVNAVRELRVRLEGEQVVAYDTIHCSSTVGRADGSYGYAFMEFYPDPAEFADHARREMTRVQALRGMCRGEAVRTDVIYFSAVPWFAFTEMKHPHFLGNNSAIPRISTGKLIRDGERLLLPVSLDVHHGMADGYHASLFYGLFEDQEF